MKTKLKMVAVIVGCLLLAMLLGIMVTRASADGPVMWKQFCPVRHDVVLVPEKGGQHVVCIMSAEVDNDDPR